MSSARRLLVVVFASTALAACGLGPKQDDPDIYTSVDSSFPDAAGGPNDGALTNDVGRTIDTSTNDTPAGPFDGCGDGGSADASCEGGDADAASDADAMDAADAGDAIADGDVGGD